MYRLLVATSGWRLYIQTCFESGRITSVDPSEPNCVNFWVKGMTQQVMSIRKQHAQMDVDEFVKTKLDAYAVVFFAMFAPPS